MKKTVIAASMALGLATSGATWAGGIQIDPLGGGSISGSNFLSVASFDTGWVLFEGCFSVSPGATSSASPDTCTMYGQSVLDSNARMAMGFSSTKTVHFGFEIPIEIWKSGSKVTVQTETNKKGTFQMFVDLDNTDAGSAEYADPTGTTNLLTGLALTAGSTGLHYSNVGADMTDSTQLLAGDIVLADQGSPTGAFDLRNDGTPATQTECDLSLGVPCSGTTDRTVLKQNSSYSALIDVTTQNNDYVVNDMKNTGFTIEGIAADITDLLASIAGTTSEQNLVQYVGGKDANYDVADSSTAKNDFTCDAGLGGDTNLGCDYQVMSKGSFKFRGQPVPEPGTLILLGGSLVLLGVVRRRKTLKVKSI